MRKRLKQIVPKGFLWRLTFLNVLILSIAIGISGWSIYHTACFLVEGIGGTKQSQQLFNSTLFQYLVIFTILGVIVSSLFHFYITKSLVRPVRNLIQSMKQLRKGSFPHPIEVTTQDEVGELISHYNELIKHLKTNEQSRQKLITDLSHEIRTPVSNLNGYLHALSSGVVSGDQELYQSLYEESKRLSQMIEQMDLLTIWNDGSSKIGITQEKISIDTLINQSLTMFDWRLSQSNISVDIHVESVELSLNVVGIQQVMGNLIDNAIHYYEGDGPIRIKGETIGAHFHICIIGPSIPISNEERAHLFDRFYRIDHSRNKHTGGSGLGLAITREIVEHHGGTIDVNYDAGKSTFCFTLPC